MEEWGNKRANEYYEANLPPTVIRPKEGDPVRVVERFIRDKYELKKYIGKTIPPKTASEPEDNNNNNQHHHANHHHHKHHGHHGHHGANGNQQKAHEAPKPAPIPEPVVAAPRAAEPSLLDFDAPAAPAFTAAPAQPVANTAAAFDPFAVTAAPAPAANAVPTTVFDPFAQPAAQQQVNPFFLFTRSFCDFILHRP